MSEAKMADAKPIKPHSSKRKSEGPDDGLTQSERFMKVARELETDDDPERFKDRVRKLTKRNDPVDRGDSTTE